MKALLLAGAVIATVACSTEPAALRVEEHNLSAGTGETPTSTVPADSAPTTTATTPVVPPTTATTEPAPALEVEPEPAPRTTTTARATQTAPVVHGEDFWYRLAGCESGNGNLSANQFQFMGGTAEKVGYYSGASYEAQRAMAIDWAARIHPREGTTAGWPVCWAVAGGS